MAEEDSSPLAGSLVAAGRVKWLIAGLLLAVVTIYLGYLSHRSFRTTIHESFFSQQAIHAKSLENSLRDHIYGEAEDILHVVREIKRTQGGIAAVSEILPELTRIHLDSFEAFSLFDREGSPLFSMPERFTGGRIALSRVKSTIFDNREEFVPFLSESYLDHEGKTAIFLLVPFKMPGKGQPTYYACAALNIEDYMFSHFPAWKGRSLGFVLAEADGDILSMMNTEHETDDMMKRGNLLRLDSACLSCHRPKDFDDMRTAAGADDAVQSQLRFPGSTVTTNRTTLAFRVYNQLWSISIYAPFERIQQAINGNAAMNLALSVFTLLMMGTLGFIIHRSIRLEEIASTTGELKESREALAMYARELEDANHIKDLFTDIVSHDLLNPVSIVKGYTSILAGQEKDSSRQKVLAAMGKSLEKVTEIIENSSTISKLKESEDIDLRYLDLGELLDNAIGSVAVQMREKQIELTRVIDGSYPVMGTYLLENVFQNLISNAVKYSGKGKKLEVAVHDENGSWCVSVKDWGEGIPDKFKALIFTRLERLDKAGIKGTGLGLAIVKRTIQLHGGAIRVEDNPEGGSVFLVTLQKGTEPLDS
jgi:signal transduction histidine kinase